MSETIQKQNYKQTEVGLIPEDWEVKSLDELTVRVGDGIHSTPKYTENGDYLFINGNNLVNGKIIITNDTKNVDISEQKKHSRELNNQTILLSINGTIGNVAYYNNEKILLGKSAAYLNIKKSFPREFFYYSIQTPEIQIFFENNLTGSTIKNLGLNTIRKAQIPFPPNLTEQRSIATALSDVDELLTSLEQLISKKQAIKQGAMQELLTPPSQGGKRLPGFSGKWEKKKLGEIAEIRDGTHQTPTYVETGIPFYSVENITKNDFQNTKFISKGDHELLTKKFKINKGDILMTRIGSIGECKFIDWNVNASFYVSLALMKIKSNDSPEYICHYSKTESFKKDVEINSLQSAIPKKINLGPISNINIETPQYNEQKAIARVLSDMDEEMKVLKEKKVKYQKIKEGMMQELLTGKIRLV